MDVIITHAGEAVNRQFRVVWEALERVQFLTAEAQTLCAPSFTRGFSALALGAERAPRLGGE